MLTILREDFPKQEVMFHLADVTKKDELERAFQEVDYKFHYIDIVITCAGIVDEPEYELMIDINLVCVFDKWNETERESNQFLIENALHVLWFMNSWEWCTQITWPYHTWVVKMDVEEVWLSIFRQWLVSIAHSSARPVIMPPNMQSLHSLDLWE